ncbi:MAG: metallophosphoesterase [Candidatus Wildermuthbacteria bacterium]|nr:metallophosphoesterase [Candidatus Wildermuthbacteria bacterium]
MKHFHSRARMSHRFFGAAFLFFSIALFGFSAVFLFASEAQAVTVIDSQISSYADDAYDVPAGWPGYSHTDTTIYAGAPGGAGPAFGGWRWTGLNLPATAQIQTAWVEFNQSGWGYNMLTTLALEKSSVPVVFSSTNSPSHRWTNKTTYELDWSWPKAGPGSWIRTPNIAAGIQEILNTQGAISEIVLIEDGTGVVQGQYHGWASFNSSPTLAAKLHIEYDSGVDAIPPVLSSGQPTGILPSGTTQAVLSLATSENASCKYDVVLGTGYAVMPFAFTTTGTLSHSTNVAGLTDGTNYSYYVRCQDGTGNANGDDYTISFSVDVPDTMPPVRSSGLPSGDVAAGTTQITLSLMTNEVATCKYAVILGVGYESMVDIFTATGSTTHSTMVTGLQDDTIYNYYVRCQDSAGNASIDDFTISFRVLPDTVPPIRSGAQPTGTFPTGTIQATLGLYTNEASICKYDTIAGNLYEVMANTFAVTGATSHSSVVEGLVNGVSYTYYVRCQDNLSNVNTDDFTILFSVAPEGPMVVDIQVLSSADDAYNAVPNEWPGYSHTDSVVYAGNVNGRVMYGGWRWTGFSIPATAQIQTAWVEFNQSGWGYNISTDLAFEKAANPSSFSSVLTPFLKWANSTVSQIAWSWPKAEPGSWIRTPNLAAALQEVVSAQGSLNSIVLLESGSLATTNWNHAWTSYDSNPALSARLHIEYTLGGPDTNPPLRSSGQPTGVLPTGTIQATLSLATNKNATCKYGATAGIAYDTMTNVFATTGGTNHSSTVTGLTDGGSYAFYARCRDASSNTNTDDYAIGFSVASVTPPPALLRGPYMQICAQDSAVIAWKTDILSDSVVLYGTTISYGSQVSDATQSAVHALSLSNLAPGTTYYYQIQSNGTVLASSSFATNKATGAFSFSALGDTGSGSQNQRDVANQIALQNSAFVLHTGDLIYPSGADADYDSQYFGIYGNTADNICVFPVLGNHDVQTGNGQPYLDNFYLPTVSSGTERYYSFDYSNTHFTALDTNMSFAVGSSQYNWLVSDLSSNAKPWKIVLFHHAPYTIGPHSADAIVTEIRNTLVPLFEQYGVQLVLNGHDHLYTRSNPINGVAYVVSGAGGNSLYLGIPAGYTASFLDNVYSFTQVTIDGSALTLKQVKQDGTIFETHVITGDVVAPIVSNANAVPTSSSVTITWTTDEISTSQVEYGTTAALGSLSSLDTSFVSTHSIVLSGFAPNTAYYYKVRSKDQNGNEVVYPMAPLSFATLPSSTPFPLNWPAKADLTVGESYNYTLRDGTARTLTLLGYTIIVPKHKIEAIVRVADPVSGKAETHTLHVAFDAVPVSVNGLKIYGYAWKEANINGFEVVGGQEGFPLTAGKDVGFAVGDANFTLFPDMDNYAYPFNNAFFEEGYMQTFLEANGLTDNAEAHSGFDKGVWDGQGVKAIADGYMWTDVTSADPETQGMIKLTATSDPYNNNQACWIWTHIRGGSVLVPDGAFVTKGTQLSNGIWGSHTHFGSCKSFDFGSWLFSAEIWNNSHKTDFPSPRYWLAVGPFIGSMAVNHIAPDENGDISVSPRKGDTADGLMWRFADNFVNSVGRMGELQSATPFSGYEYVAGETWSQPERTGYVSTYIYSPVDHTADNAVHLKWGVSDSGKAWLNGRNLNVNGSEARFAAYNTSTETPIVIDAQDVALPLQAGWNNLILKTNQGTRSLTAWLFSAKIGDASGNAIPDLKFSTRDINLRVTDQGSNYISLAWSHPDFHGTFIDSYKLDVATDPGFQNLVVNNLDIRRVSSYKVGGLTPNTNYYVRVTPFNASDMGGSRYWQNMDMVTGATVAEDVLPPSATAPGGLVVGQVPQFVLLGSDDNNRAGGVEFFINAMKNRLNPVGTGNPGTFDGAPALMSFYLIGTNIFGPNINSQEWRDQYMAAYADGHELGNHGFYGLANEAPRGTVSDWINSWIKPTHDAMIDMGVDAKDIKGMRAAQDEIDPAFYQALKQFGYTYGNSSTTGHSTNLPAWWTGTLENGWTGGATWDTRNFGNTPGIWEIPQTYATGQSAYCDKDWFGAPANKTGAQYVEDLKATFLTLRNGNKAPFSICLHSQEWGPMNTIAGGGVPSATELDRQAAMNEFLDWLLNGQFPDVRLVTHSQLLDWMRNPVSLSTP